MKNIISKRRFTSILLITGALFSTQAFSEVDSSTTKEGEAEDSEPDCERSISPIDNIWTLTIGGAK